MSKAAFILAPLTLALAIAGCGSSHSSSNAAATPPATSSVAASSSPSGPYGAYGGGQSASSATPSAAPAALITTKRAGKLGTVLAFGSKRLTVYLFEADRDGRSSCTGTCAKVWPPVIGTPQGAGGAMSADLGVITRPDGTKQVTYKGHPLYMYIKDKDDGDAYGEGINSFGAAWYALSPAGSKIDLS